MIGFIQRKLAELREGSIHREPRTRRPSDLGCEKTTNGLHRWEYSGSWNGNSRRVLPFETDTTGIARSGWRCYHCGQFHWDETDEVFALKFAYYTGRLPGVREFIREGTPYTLTNGRTNAPYYPEPNRWTDPEV